MNEPTIRSGEEIPLYEDGRHVASVRLRSSEMGAVLQVRQLTLHGIWDPAWQDMMYVVTRDGRIAWAMTGRHGKEPTI